MRIILLAVAVALLSISSAHAYDAPDATAPTGAEVYIVTFAEPGALKYEGGVDQFRNTAKIIRSPEKNAGANPDVKAYMNHLDGVLDGYNSQLNAALGRQVQPLLRYRVRTTGMAVSLTESEAQHVANLPGVEEVRKDVMYQLETDAGPQWIGADSIWDGTATPDFTPNFGAGVLVGVLDTGVNMDHPSFSGAPADAHVYTNPFGDGVFIGACDGTFVCNNKLVGVWDFTDAVTAENDGPEDGNGHGTHTASTAAGNFVPGPIPVNGGNFPAPSVSGVARHANLITYDVCFENCPGAAIQGGIDQALLDGVDIVNFSISGGLSPWNDNDRGFLDLTGNGTLVNASAGNLPAGDNDPVGDVAHRGPWVMTVANQTHNRAASNPVSAIGGPANLQDMYGQMGSANLFGGSDVTAVAEYAGNIDAGNFEGCNAWPGGSFTGQIALISRGSCNFSVKIDNAAAAGAVAALIFNHLGVIPTAMGGIETTTIPSLMIGLSDGTALRDYITNNPGTQVTMEAVTLRIINDDLGSIINPGSLRGPNNSFSVTKPDIGGPGTNILAAYADNIGPPPQYAFLSGTSMSSPHSAGSAALLKSLNPDWSPAEIKSALMMTARTSFDEVGGIADPDIAGSGTIDLSRAALAGLVLDENFDNFLAANPATGGDPSTLNLASMRSNACNGTCSWTRTVCSTLDTEESWETNGGSSPGWIIDFTPSEFTLAPRGSLLKGGFEDEGASSSCQTIQIEATVTDQQIVDDGVFVFDALVLNPVSGPYPNMTLTISILPTAVAP